MGGRRIVIVVLVVASTVELVTFSSQNFLIMKHTNVRLFSKRICGVPRSPDVSYSMPTRKRPGCTLLELPYSHGVFHAIAFRGF